MGISRDITTMYGHIISRDLTLLSPSRQQHQEATLGGIEGPGKPSRSGQAHPRVCYYPPRREMPWWMA